MKTLTIQNGLVFNNPSGVSVLLNHAGKAVATAPRSGNGVLFSRAHKMNLKLVNETSALGQQILAKMKNN